MKKYILCFLVLSFLLTLPGKAQDASEPKTQPNIILFFIDDMGWRDWSGNGSDYLDTPSIDRIAKEGVLFEQGYVNAANCAPSRCAMLSGQYTPRNHFYNVHSIHRGNKKTDRLSLQDVRSESVLADERISFGEAMKDAGYATAMYGKWHVAGNEKLDGTRIEGGIYPAQQGFDDVLEHNSLELIKVTAKNNDPKQIYTYTKRAIEFMEKSTAGKKPFLVYRRTNSIKRLLIFTF